MSDEPILVVDLEKSGGWTDAARKASIRSRKRGAKPEEKPKKKNMSAAERRQRRRAASKPRSRH